MNKPLFLSLCAAHGLPEPVPEYRFDDTRKWRFDWLFDGWCALEIEGGAFKGHGHRSVGVFLKNLEKYNEAAIRGFCLLRVTTDDIESGAAFALVKRALETKAIVLESKPEAT